MGSDRSKHHRIYLRDSCVVFLKTNESFGGLSNMAGRYPVKINGVCIRSSEALYQACRFPHMPRAQEVILQQTSPMTAKMKSKKYRKDSRSDWERLRVTIMRWCLRVKLAYNYDSFAGLLLSTKDNSIVEESRKDSFWGARPEGEDTLIGYNVLGRLLMELREEVQRRPVADFRTVNPPEIENFLLLNRKIGIISAPSDVGNPHEETVTKAYQRDLF